MEETNCLMLHETLLGEDNYRVVVKVSFNDNAPLPLLNEYIGSTLVGQIIGSLIAWPKFLFIFDYLMVNILSFNLFCLIKNILLTLKFYYRWTQF